MLISARDLGKKYNRQWIFRHFDFDFQSGTSYAITGPNGSGKSTLLQLLTGYFPPTHGKIAYQNDENALIQEEAFFSYLDIVTPYLELIEEFTLNEFLEFHFKFKQLRLGFTTDQVVDKMYLNDDRDKLIGHFSSGMKQRLKLGIAFFSDSPVCFLDEPTTNLDSKGVAWYLENIREIISEKLVLISSNQSYEYDFCDQIVHVPDFK